MTDRVAGGEARRRPGGLVPAASAGPRGPGRRKRSRCGRAATPARLRRGCGRGRAARRSRRPAGVRGGAFADARNILGAGEARNRTRRAVERIVPFALIVSTLVNPWYARHGHPRHAVTARRHDQPWYHAKTEPAFEDMLIQLRRTMIADRISAGSSAPPTPEQTQQVLAACAFQAPSSPHVLITLAGDLRGRGRRAARLAVTPAPAYDQRRRRYALVWLTVSS